jgi:Pvc16 N-terminal domain
MASFQAIAAVGRTLERLLNACFDEEEPIDAGNATKAVLVRSDEFDLTAVDNPLTPPALSIFLVRIEVNAAQRATWSAAGAADGRAHLPLDLHYLLTAWAANAEFEHLILGRTMQCLEEHPILTGPILYPSATWADHEAVQVVPDESGLDSVLRAFESLESDFRLSIPYVARVVRLDGRERVLAEPVRTALAGAKPGLT